MALVNRGGILSGVMRSVGAPVLAQPTAITDITISARASGAFTVMANA